MQTVHRAQISAPGKGRPTFLEVLDTGRVRIDQGTNNILLNREELARLVDELLRAPTGAVTPAKATFVTAEPPHVA